MIFILITKCVHLDEPKSLKTLKFKIHRVIVVGLNQPHLNVLKVMAKYGGTCTVDAIADSLSISNVYAWQLVTKLAEMGYVQKIARGLYSLTDEGRAVLEKE